MTAWLYVDDPWTWHTCGGSDVDPDTCPKCREEEKL